MLWLRGATAILFIRNAVLVWEGGHSVIWCVALMVAGLALGVGVLTPAICVLSILLSVSSRQVQDVEAWPLSFLVVSVLVSMALLGPGAYSVDAWLFGRKKLRIGQPTS